MAARLLSIGNATIDAFLTLHNANKDCRIDPTTKELCIKHGEKIMVDSCEFLMGGNACNIAVGLSRLGIEASLAAEIGDDELSEKILRFLYGEKVDFRMVKRTPHAATSFAVALNMLGERTLFVEHVKRRHVFDFSDFSFDWVYLNSMGEEWEECYEKVVRMVHSENAKLAFSPGGHQLQKKSDVIARVLDSADVVLINKEEKEVLESQYGWPFGSHIVVVTDGKNGAIAYDGQKQYECGIVEASVVEKTGAGDAFAAGFLAALIEGNDIESSLRWGALNGAAVVGKIGAQTGLLKREEIENKMSSKI